MLRLWSFFKLWNDKYKLKVYYFHSKSYKHYCADDLHFKKHGECKDPEIANCKEETSSSVSPTSFTITFAPTTTPVPTTQSIAAPTTNVQLTTENQDDFDLRKICIESCPIHYLRPHFTSYQKYISCIKPFRYTIIKYFNVRWFSF